MTWFLIYVAIGSLSVGVMMFGCVWFDDDLKNAEGAAWTAFILWPLVLPAVLGLFIAKLVFNRQLKTTKDPET